MVDGLVFDYLIVGGGLCGCVVASRLKQAFPNRSVAIIEAGADSRDDPAVLSLAGAQSLTPGHFFAYETAPQRNLNGREIPLLTGKVLGGGSAVNYGGWTRGDRAGYDEWASLVEDDRWSYDGLLPYFKRSETYSAQGLEQQHGYEGPIHATVSTRRYPLRERIWKAMQQTGAEDEADANGGSILGIAALAENWHNGKRSFAAKAYDLSEIEVLTNCVASKILIEGGKAIGVLLTDGRSVRARQEVIVSCGAIKTPQLLVLSGIGPKAELDRLQIPVVVDAPAVGQNLHDHPFIAFWFQLRNPEAGLALGSEAFMANPEFLAGAPMDWFLNASMAEQDRRKAAEVDGTLSSRKDDIEIPMSYGVFPPNPLAPPSDGSHMTVSVIGLSTTSRGQISLRSKDPKEAPVIDLAYLNTEHDRAMVRSGARLAFQVTETGAGKDVFVGETPPSEQPPLSGASSDQVFDARVRQCVGTAYHYAGTAAMGKVVDNDCRVFGTKGLRVIDASILPVSVGGHLQAALYGVAERAVQMIIDDAK